MHGKGRQTISITIEQSVVASNRSYEQVKESLEARHGMVEGHVIKLKLIKRQGYGRAGFPLLRKRVLHAV